MEALVLSAGLDFSQGEGCVRLTFFVDCKAVHDDMRYRAVPRRTD